MLFFFMPISYWCVSLVYGADLPYWDEWRRERIGELHHKEQWQLAWAFHVFARQRLSYVAVEVGRFLCGFPVLVKFLHSGNPFSIPLCKRSAMLCKASLILKRNGLADIIRGSENNVFYNIFLTIKRRWWGYLKCRFRPYCTKMFFFCKNCSITCKTEVEAWNVRYSKLWDKTIWNSCFRMWLLNWFKKSSNKKNEL